MSTYHYLVRPDNKTMYELGKDGGWINDLSIFEVKKTNNLLQDDNCAEEQHIKQYKINDVELLLITLTEHFNSDSYGKNLSRDAKYIEYVKNGILKFCDDKDVFLLNDCYETCSVLKHEYGFIVSDTRYIK